MIRLRTLGSLDLHDETGRSLDHVLVQPKRLALLVYLAAAHHGGVHRRDQLLSMFWPELDDARARDALNQALRFLRQELGADAFVRRGDEIGVATDRLWCDAVAFRAALERGRVEEALELYRGEFLTAFHVDDCRELDEWLERERAALGRAAASGAWRVVSACEARDEVSSAIAWARRAVALQPDDEPGLRHLLQLHRGAGDRAGALRAYGEFERRLRAEFGCDPSPETTAVIRDLLAHDGDALVTRTPNGSTGAATPARAGTTTPDHRGARTPESSEPRRRALDRTRRTLAVTALLTVVGIGTWIALGASKNGHQPKPGAETIAILPFRVSGADSSLAYLRDGLVELLALQFTGEVGPAAVEAGEALRVWYDSHPDDAAATPVLGRQVARQLRAARFTTGAIVGTADHFTVTASVIDASSGDVVVPAVQVSGSMDSLGSVIADLSLRLQAGGAGSWRLAAIAAGSPNADVLRAYLRGMVAYRNGHWTQAGAELYRAMQMDSSFVPSAYRFALIHAITAPISPLGTPAGRERLYPQLYGRLWHQRHRLSPDQRLVLEAVADSHYVLWRMQALPRLERVVTLLPSSVEAWDILGDAYFHAGALTGREDWAARASHAFQRARSLDSTIAVNARQHLADLAFMKGDVQAHASVATATVGPRGPDYLRYQAALLGGDRGAIRVARNLYAGAWARGDEDGIDWALHGLTLPASELDSLIIQLTRDAATAEQRRAVAEWTVEALMMSGRPAKGAAALRRLHEDDTTAIHSDLVAYAIDDSIAATILPRTSAVDSRTQLHPIGCNAALARLRHGDSTGTAALLATLPTMDPRLPAAEAVLTVKRGNVAQATVCGEVLRGVYRSSASDGLPLLLRADSVMRLTPLNYADFWNYDLAHAFAARGDYRAAAAAVRRHFIDLLPLPRLPLALRDEGRWAALAGDTTAAIAAFRHYLLWRESPEPVLMPERDSVRAELAALEQARSRRLSLPR